VEASGLRFGQGKRKRSQSTSGSDDDGIRGERFPKEKEDNSGPGEPVGLLDAGVPHFYSNRLQSCFVN